MVLSARGSVTEYAHAVSESTAVSAGLVGCTSPTIKIDWSMAGNILEDTLEEINEVISEDGNGSEAPNADDPVLDWLGYLDFVEAVL